MILIGAGAWPPARVLHREAWTTVDELRSVLERCAAGTGRDLQMEMGVRAGSALLSRGDEVVEVWWSRLEAGGGSQETVRDGVSRARFSITAAGGGSDLCRTVMDAIEHEVEELAGLKFPMGPGHLLGSMPLTSRAAGPGRPLAGWAGVLRADFVPGLVALADGLIGSGMEPASMAAWCTGAETSHHRFVERALTERGVRHGRLDASEASRAVAIDHGMAAAAASAGKLLVIDEGAEAAPCLAALGRVPDLVVQLSEAVAVVDAAGIPEARLVEVGRSKAVRHFVERGLAASVAAHVRTLIPDQKLIGRRVLVTGFRSRGRWLAREFRAMGCRVAVAEDDCLRAIDAADDGYESYRGIGDALGADAAALVVIPPGSRPLDGSDLEKLPDGCVLLGSPALSSEMEVIGAAALGGSLVRTAKCSGRCMLVLGGGTGSRRSPFEGLAGATDDLYRASVLVAVRQAVTAPGPYDGRQVDRIMQSAGLFRLMYETYLRDGRRGRT